MLKCRTVQVEVVPPLMLPPMLWHSILNTQTAMARWLHNIRWGSIIPTTIGSTCWNPNWMNGVQFYTMALDITEVTPLFVMAMMIKGIFISTGAGAVLSTVIIFSHHWTPIILISTILMEPSFKSKGTPRWLRLAVMNYLSCAQLVLQAKPRVWPSMG